MPSQSIVVIAASATDPCFFSMSAPICAHSFPFAATAPCMCSCFGSESFLMPKLYPIKMPMTMTIDTMSAIKTRLREMLVLASERKINDLVILIFDENVIY